MLKLQKILKNILEILKTNDEHIWYQKINILYQDSFKVTKLYDQEFILRIESLYGGMGSFDDLVLHKNNIPLIEENNQLELLKNDLYIECIKIREVH
jgi:hypothetical protein